MLIIISLVFIVLNIILSIAEVLDPGKGKPSAQRVIGMSLISIITGYFWLIGIPVSEPVLVVSEDRTGFIFTERELFEKTQYCIREKDTDNINWIDYKEGEVISVHHDPTIVMYKNKLWLNESNTITTRIHVDKSGNVREFDNIPQIKSISATYIEKELSDNRASNTFAGYVLKDEDFKVIGVNREGEEEVLKEGFSFKPNILKEGENSIEIEYIDSEETKTTCNVSIYAYAPQILSISAKLKSEYINKVKIGTMLDSSMFDVIGVYEDGRKLPIDGFSIQPIETPDEEGEYTFTITKGDLYEELNIKVVDPDNIVEEENESGEGNDSFESANRIDVNSNYKGKLFKSNDVDYYKFTIKQKGSVKIWFKHPKIDSTSRYWSINLFPVSGDNENALISDSSKGANSEMETYLVRLAAGTYCLKISKYDYRDDDYYFKVIYEEEDDSYESELNNDNSSATPIEVNSEMPYIGNLSNKKDFDYFMFELNEKGKILINFNHNKTDSSSRLYQLTMQDQSEKILTSIYSRGNESSISTDAIRVPPGLYYLRIKADDWNEYASNKDYNFYVKYWNEGTNAESEPNNDYDVATELLPYNKMLGNIQSEKDIDFYYFNYDGSKDLILNFEHGKTNNNSRLWTISLEGTSSGESIINTDGDKKIFVRGNDSDNVVSQWTDLDPGLYYIRVSKYDYSNDDYTIILEY